AAAIEQPGRADRGVLEEAQHALLVVPLEINALEAGQLVVEQELDHRPRFVAAIDIVAEIDHHVARRLAPVGILMDEAAKPVQQVDAAMDVADGIDAAAGRRLRHDSLAWPGGMLRATGAHGQKYGAGRPIAPHRLRAARCRPGGFACQIRPFGPKRTACRRPICCRWSRRSRNRACCASATSCSITTSMARSSASRRRRRSRCCASIARSGPWAAPAMSCATCTRWASDPASSR